MGINPDKKRIILSLTSILYLISLIVAPSSYAQDGYGTVKPDQEFTVIIDPSTSKGLFYHKDEKKGLFTGFLGIIKKGSKSPLAIKNLKDATIDKDITMSINNGQITYNWSEAEARIEGIMDSESLTRGIVNANLYKDFHGKVEVKELGLEFFVTIEPNDSLEVLFWNMSIIKATAPYVGLPGNDIKLLIYHKDKKKGLFTGFLGIIKKDSYPPFNINNLEESTIDKDIKVSVNNGQITYNWSEADAKIVGIMDSETLTRGGTNANIDDYFNGEVNDPGREFIVKIDPANDMEMRIFSRGKLFSGKLGHSKVGDLAPGQRFKDMRITKGKIESFAEKGELKFKSAEGATMEEVTPNGKQIIMVMDSDGRSNYSRIIVED